MKKEKRRIVNFDELSSVWQQEAIDILGRKHAEKSSYLEPIPGISPRDKYLIDLSECIAVTPADNDGANGVISISKNSAMLLRIDDKFESADVWYI